LLIMYFGVVGVGIGVQNYSTIIIQATNPSLSSVDLSLLSAPIWLMDLLAILLITPISDRFHRHRALFFSAPVVLQILGLLLMTYAGSDANPWPRYGGLLIVGFGLGPTVPVTMTWTNELFQPRHGEVGVAAASAVVSGWGNLGSILTTYALYTGWKSDAEAPGMAKYRKSNLVMVGILGGSILAAFLMQFLVWLADRKNPVPTATGQNDIVDGAARREADQRGLHGLGSGLTKIIPKNNKLV
jgi:MFS family permease